MPLSATLSGEAVGLFERNWQRRLARTRIHIGRIDCPLHWLMPELLQLAQEFGDCDSLHEMRPLVHRLVQELDSVNQAAVHEANERTLEAYVDTLVDVLESVRTRARERGQWVGGSAPAAVPMCG